MLFGVYQGFEKLLSGRILPTWVSFIYLIWTSGIRKLARLFQNTLWRLLFSWRG